MLQHLDQIWTAGTMRHLACTVLLLLWVTACGSRGPLRHANAPAQQQQLPF